MVDLREAIDAAKGEVRIIKMQGTEQPVTNVSSTFTSGEASQFQR